MSETARQRWWLCGFSLAASLVVTLPFLLMPLQRRFYETRFPAEAARWPLNGSFSALEPFHMDVDEYPYAARMRHAASHLVPGDAHIKENASARLAARDWLTFEVMALFYRAAGGPSRAWVLLKLVFSALWVPLLYLVLRACGAQRGPALALAVIGTVFNDLTRLPMSGGARAIAGAAAQYSLWPLGSYNYWFGPTRLTRPLLSYAFLFAAALLAARASSRRDWRSAAAAGAAGGALAYVHPDVWAAYVGATGLLAAWLCWKERAALKTLLGSLALTAAVSAPWAWLSFSRPEDHGLAAAALSRQPDLRGLLYAAAAALAFRLRRGSAMMLWLAWLLVAVALLLNLQVVLPVQAADPALWCYLGNTFGALVVGKLAFDAVELDAAGWRWLAACAILAAAPRAVGYSAHHFRLYALERDEEAALRWLDANAARDSVVAALSPLTVLRVPIYTGCKTLTSMIFPLTSDISFRENARRLQAALALYGADAKRFVDQGFDRSSAWESRLWHGEVDVRGHERSGAIMRYFLKLDDPARFEETLRAAALDERDYRAEYLWVGPFERALMPGGRLAKRLAAREVFSNATVKIYALAPPLTP
jgi:hypothetical protein